MKETDTSPRLETDRLGMRWLTLDDAELMLAVWNDPAFIKHVGDRGVYTLEQAQEALQSGAFQLYKNYGYGPFRLTRRDTGEAVGICGLFRREGFDDPDIGWSVLPEYCGKGYAYEAASAVLDYAWRDVGLSRVTAFVDAKNTPSVGLAKKLGLTFECMARLVGDDEDVCLYSVGHG